jgi:hypothetical protein
LSDGGGDFEGAFDGFLTFVEVGSTGGLPGISQRKLVRNNQEKSRSGRPLEYSYKRMVRLTNAT